MTYEQWMKQVDAHVWARLGCSVHDLCDFMSRDMYDDGASPEEAALEAMQGDDLAAMYLNEMEELDW